MNQTAKELGLYQTHFANPHGLNNKDNYSTAKDVAKLCLKALQVDMFINIVSTQKWETQVKYYTKIGGMVINRKIEWENTNLLLKNVNYKGIKTGITTKAGACLASFYKEQQRGIVVVILGCKQIQSRFHQTKKIIKDILQFKQQK